MFVATIRAGVLQDALDPVHALVEECKIHLDDDGLEIRAVDPANVGMVDLELDVEAFESYQADGGLIGVNLVRLTDVAGMGDSDDLVSLELDEETRKLHITIDGLEYTLALIDPESIREEPDLPDLDLECLAVLHGAQLDRAVTAADMVSDHIRLFSDGETMSVEAHGDTDDVDVSWGDDDLLSASGALADADSLFSLDYIQDMVAPMERDSEISLHLGEEMPFDLSFESGDGVEVRYMLAPRIQSEGGS